MNRFLGSLLLFITILIGGCSALQPIQEPAPDPAAAQSATPARYEVPSYHAFAGLTSVEIWHFLDSAEFDHVPLAPPADYYSEIDISDSAALRKTLHERIRDHTVFRYTNSTRPGDPNHKVDTWDIIALADAHPEEPDRVLDIYQNASFDRQLAGTRDNPRYDREHSWPKSLGFPSDRLSNPAYSDVHHLFAAYNRYNASRSNNAYGTGDPSEDARRPTVANLGRGGHTTVEPDSSNFRFDDVWQTWIGRRGDVSRAMFYMDARYEGDLFGAMSEPNLELTDDLNLIDSADVRQTGEVAFMGLLSVLLQWHKEDPVDNLERRRNTIVHLFQGNRNPFIDHPEWVSIIYGAND